MGPNDALIMRTCPKLPRGVAIYTALQEQKNPLTTIMTFHKSLTHIVFLASAIPRH